MKYPAEPYRRPVPTVQRDRRAWVRVFTIGLALWLLSVLVTYATENIALVPMVVLLGSFLVPVTFVAWAFGQRHTPAITTGLLFNAFIVGGVLGVLAASLVESFVLRPSIFLFLGVGLIEEAVKLGALLLVSRRLRPKVMRDGIILGAAVGFGFAAFETAGYALRALLATGHGLSLSAVVETEILRSVLAPVGHGLWTALLGGVVFHAARYGRFRLTGTVFAAYLGVSVLHGLWDATPGVALLITLLISGRPGQYQALERGDVPVPTGDQVFIFAGFTVFGFAIVAALGLMWLLTLWRRSRRELDTGQPV